MSRDALPDDPQQWPGNAYQLLGVPANAGLPEVRKAYAALIRQYPPDHAPEGFRRIRDAYEYIVARLRQRAPRQEPEEIISLGAPEKQDEEPDAVPMAEVASFGESSIAEEVTAAWELARSGMCELSYHKLNALRERGANSADLCLRLYWLLRLEPDLDAQREPVDWLVTALSLAALRGPAAELYRRELQRHPEEVTAQRCANLYDVAATQAALSDLAGWRWKAAAAIGRFDVIRDDVVRLREPLRRQSEELWFHTLMSAASNLAWSEGKQEQLWFAGCCEEIEEMTHLHNSLRSQFDRLDALRELAKVWGMQSPLGFTAGSGAPTSVPPEWMPLLRDWHNGEREQLRPRLLPVLANIATFPKASFGFLIALESRGSLVSLAFAEMLAWFVDLQQEEDLAQPAYNAVAPLVRAWLDTQPQAGYSGLRCELLNFCTEQTIPPPLVAAIGEDNRHGCLFVNESFQHKVENDLPLKAFFDVCMMF